MFSNIYTNKKTAWLTALLTVVGSFLFVTPSLAFVTAQQTSDSSAVTSTSAGSVWGQTFTANISGLVTDVTMYVSSAAGFTGNDEFCIGPASGVVSATGTCSGKFTITTGKIQYTKTLNTTSTAYYLVAGQQYALYNNGSSGSAKYEAYGSAGNIYSGGRYCQALTNDFSACQSNTSVQDMYFSVSVNGSGNTTGIEFTTFPTSTCDFEQWNTQSTYSTTDAATARANHWIEAVNYAQVVDGHIYGSYYEDANLNPCLDGSVCGSGNGFNLPISKLNALTPLGVYIATPFIFGDNISLVHATSSAIYQGTSWLFYIQPGGSAPSGATSTCPTVGLVPAPGITSPWTTTTPSGTIVPVFDCGDKPSALDVGATAGWYVCKAMQMLFIPSSNAVAQLQTIGTTIQSKPPFGYISIYANEVNTLQSATSTTSTLATSTFNFDSTTSALSSLSVIQTIKTYVYTTFLGVAVLFYIYKRFKYFSLHG